MKHPLRKKVTLTCIGLNGDRRKIRYQAPPGRILTEAGIDGWLDKMATALQEANPGKEFRLVPLLDGNFNIVELAPTQSALKGAVTATQIEPSPLP